MKKIELDPPYLGKDYEYVDTIYTGTKWIRRYWHYFSGKREMIEITP